MTTREMEIWEVLVEWDIATIREIELVTAINGMNEESLNDILYARTGYRTIEQILNEDEED